jgi:hypothetical protein
MENLSIEELSSFSIFNTDINMAKEAMKKLSSPFGRSIIALQISGEIRKELGLSNEIRVSEVGNVKALSNISPITNKEEKVLEGKDAYIIWSDGSFTLKADHEVEIAWNIVKDKLRKLEHPFHFEYKYVPVITQSILIEWYERNKELLIKENLNKELIKTEKEK